MKSLGHVKKFLILGLQIRVHGVKSGSEYRLGNRDIGRMFRIADLVSDFFYFTETLLPYHIIFKFCYRIKAHPAGIHIFQRLGNIVYVPYQLPVFRNV